MRALINMVLLANLSLGVISLCGADGALIRPGDVWRYLVALEEPPSDWRALEFDDSSWQLGPSGFSQGFGKYDEATVPEGFPGDGTTFYLRRLFVITNLADVVWPVLRIDYDDGFVAQLNGEEIARRGLVGNTGETVPFDTIATTRPRGVAEEIDLRSVRQLLVVGTNVLALQVHRTEPPDVTIAVVPELLSGITRGPFLQSTSSNRTLVVWKTAIPSDATIKFGATPSLARSVANPILTNSHVIELTGLTADTEYFYRVKSTAGSETVRSAVLSFRTFKTGGNMRFLVLADTGVGQVPQYELAKLLSARRSDLVLHLGDIAYPEFTVGRADSKLFSVYHETMRSVPWYFAIGNHDLYAGESHYLNTFHLPTNSPTGGQRYYSFDHGDVHFSVLKIPYLSQYKLTVGDPQYQWLTNDLATTTRLWKVLLYHVPMQTSALHRTDDQNLNGRFDGEEIREVLLPVAEKYGVQVTFSGHDHVFERFAPTNGVHTITTGGGGVVLYGFVERCGGSVQFWSRHHFTEVVVEGDRMEITAIDRFGDAFDSQVIHRAPAADLLYPASWHTPTVESAPQDDGDGNINGQLFDFAGTPIPTRPGMFSNLGEVRVNNDKTHLHIGLDRALLRNDSVVYLFIESPGTVGVGSLIGLGNGVVDPDVEGADGLDLLENLSFVDFAPTVGFILGDEKSDNTFRSFQRPGQTLNTGQGAFLLNASLDDVGARIQQFNRSPQTGPVNIEQNADFIEISIPYSNLGGLKTGDTVRLGAVVAGAGFDAATQRQRLDTAFLGTAMTGSGTNDVMLTGVRVQLAADPDCDGDGLPNDWELANNFDPDSAAGIHGATGDFDVDGADNLHEFMAGTDPRNAQSVFKMWLNPLSALQLEIRWKTVPGLRYELESAADGSVSFSPLANEFFPRTATGNEDVFTNDISGSGQLFRVKRVE